MSHGRSTWHPASSPKSVRPRPTIPAPHHRLDPYMWTEAVSAHGRGCLPHLPAESSRTLLTTLLRSKRLSPVREAQASHRQSKEKRRQPAEQEVKIGVPQLRSQPATLSQTMTHQHNTTPGSATESTNPTAPGHVTCSTDHHQPTAYRPHRNSEE